MIKHHKDVTNTHELFKKIVDSDKYTIDDVTGKPMEMTGANLKAYIISMRGQMNFDSLIQDLTKPAETTTAENTTTSTPVKDDKTEVKTESKKEEKKNNATPTKKEEATTAADTSKN